MMEKQLNILEISFIIFLAKSEIWRHLTPLDLALEGLHLCT